MALAVETKDTAQLTEEEFVDIDALLNDEELSITQEDALDLVEDWVLVTLAYDGKHLRGFAFTTLERIGGTPAVLLGYVAIKGTSRRSTVLNGIMNENYRRALMAFPDEDVLFGTPLFTPGGFDVLKGLADINPRPDYKASGEDRAWGRRLAKRFSVDKAYDASSFTTRKTAPRRVGLRYETLHPEKLDKAVVAQFSDVDTATGDAIVGFGWMMAEELLKYS